MREYLMPILVVAALALASLQQVEVAGRCVEGRSQEAEQGSPNNEVTKSEERAQSALDKSYGKGQ